MAWAGALFFVIALIYFLYSYLISFGTAASPATRIADPITWNVALFTIFALHHSIFARTAVRDWLTRVVPAELERTFYVWVASLLFVAVCRLWRPVPGSAWRVEGAAFWTLSLVQAAGVWLALRSALYLDVFELAGVRQVETSRTSGRPTEFKTSGPYGWVRHPIYAGWFLIVFAAPVMTMTRLLFAVVSSVYLLLAIPLEERSLRMTSPGLYERYRKTVRWKLVPGIY